MIPSRAIQKAVAGGRLPDGQNLADDHAVRGDRAAVDHAAIEADQRIHENGCIRDETRPAPCGKSRFELQLALSREGARDRLVMGCQKIDRKDTVLVEPRVRQAGLVQAEENRRRFVGDGTDRRHRHASSAGRTIRRHETDRRGEMAHRLPEMHAVGRGMRGDTGLQHKAFPRASRLAEDASRPLKIEESVEE